MIRRAIGGKGDVVVALGRFARDEPVRYIERDLRRIALGGIAEAAAARQFEADEIAAGDALPALRADRLAGDQSNPPGRTRAAAVAPACGIAYPLEIAQH